jgi:predicted transcriptional regulator
MVVVIPVAVEADSPATTTAHDGTTVNVGADVAIDTSALPVASPVQAVSFDQDLPAPVASVPVLISFRDPDTDLDTRQTLGTDLAYVDQDGGFFQDHHSLDLSTPVIEHNATDMAKWSDFAPNNSIPVTFWMWEGSGDATQTAGASPEQAMEGMAASDTAAGSQYTVPAARRAGDAVDQTPHLRYHVNTEHVAINITETPKLFVANRSNLTSVVSNSRAGASVDLPVAEHDKRPETPLSQRTPPVRGPPLPPAPSPQGGPGNLSAQAITTQVRPVGGHAAVVALVAGTALSYVFITLYSLFQPKEVLNSETRRRIYDTIEANPGITIVEVAEKLSVKHQTICYHLQLLKRAGFIVAEPKGNRVLHFINGAGLNEAERRLLAIHPKSVTMGVLLEVVKSPSIRKRDVATAVGLTRTGGAWHVNKLVTLGLVREAREHGHCRLYPIAENVSALLGIKRPTPDENVA